jgi:nucleoid DNA-binding protein
MKLTKSQLKQIIIEELALEEYESSDPLKKILDILENVLSEVNMRIQNLGTSRSHTEYERGAQDLAEEVLGGGLEEAVSMLQEILDAADQKAAGEILSTLGPPLPKTLPGGVKYEE